MKLRQLTSGDRVYVAVFNKENLSIKFFIGTVETVGIDMRTDNDEGEIFTFITISSDNWLDMYEITIPAASEDSLHQSYDTMEDEYIIVSTNKKELQEYFAKLYNKWNTEIEKL